MYRRGHIGVEVADPPRSGLWVMLVKVGHEVLIREVPKSGTVVSHAVGLTGEVEGTLLVAEHSLVHRLEPKQVGGWPRTRGGSFC